MASALTVRTSLLDATIVLGCAALPAPGAESLGRLTPTPSRIEDPYYPRHLSQYVDTDLVQVFARPGQSARHRHAD